MLSVFFRRSDRSIFGDTVYQSNFVKGQSACQAFSTPVFEDSCALARKTSKAFVKRTSYGPQ